MYSQITQVQAVAVRSLEHQGLQETAVALLLRLPLLPNLVERGALVLPLMVEVLVEAVAQVEAALLVLIQSMRVEAVTAVLVA